MSQKLPRTLRIEDIAYRVCKVLGATADELAQILNISADALEELKSNNPRFAQEIRRGQLLADANVAERLYRLAMGYTRTVTRSYFPPGEAEPVMATYDEAMPPDRTACVHWLRNRQPSLWGKCADVEYSAASILDDARLKH